MSILYFAVALSDGMINSDANITRQALRLGQVKAAINHAMALGTLKPCLDHTHQAILDALYKRYDICISVPSTTAQVNLAVNDRLIVMNVKGLPRLTANRKEYHLEEIAAATFVFTLWQRTA